MRALLASTVLAMPLLALTQPVKAQYLTPLGGPLSHTFVTPGISGTINQNVMGNIINTRVNTNRGNLFCRTTIIGSFVKTNCL